MYIEDVYVKFFDQLWKQGCLHTVQSNDRSAFKNFYNLLTLNKQVTEKQSRYILLLLKKYSSYGTTVGFDIDPYLNDPEWKNTFRQIDESKKVYLETENNQTFICLKFPYKLVEEFDKEVLPTADFAENIWDVENRVRKISLYDYNLFVLRDFLHRNNFEIDDSFENFMSTVEEIWNQSDAIMPYSTVDTDGQITLHNASEEAHTYYNQKCSDRLYDNLLLLKKMGYPLKTAHTDCFYKMVSYSTNQYRLSNFETFFDITEKISGKVCIVLDKSEEYQDWIANFLNNADQRNVSRNNIKVCFRENNEHNADFNSWVKEQEVTGKIDTESKYLIFRTKPAKWLLKELDDVSILVSTNVFMQPSKIMRDLIESFPCVFLLNEINLIKDKSVVEL